MKLSILMPVYNEADTLDLAVKRVLDVSYPCEVELVMVNDGSADRSGEIIEHLDDPRIVKGSNPVNRGKGAALRTAAGLATGDYVIICDADLEYSPRDIPKLLEPVIAGDADVVFGTRTFGSHTAHSFWYVMGNWGLTMLTNLLFNSWLSDIHTCFKLMPLSTYRQLELREDGFGADPEAVGKLLRAGIRPYEVPISYKARGHEQGKKLTWRDGVEALRILVQVRFSKEPVLVGTST